MPRKKKYDVTVHMRRKDKRRMTEQEARNAFWAAQEIARHGGDVNKEMREWELVAIDWQTTPGKLYHYDKNAPSTAVEALQNLVGIIREVGKAGLSIRLGRPE